MNDNTFQDLLNGFPCTGKLLNIERCARAVVIAANIEVLQYTYYAGGKLYIAEKFLDGWSLREEPHLHDTVRELYVLLGDSPISRTQFVLELSHTDAACLLAMMDCYAAVALRVAAGEKAELFITTQSVNELISAPKEAGLLDLLNSVCRNIEANITVSLDNLEAKGLCSRKPKGYLLNDELAALSTALAMPQAVVSLCLWGSNRGHTVSIPSFAIEGTLHDCLMISVGVDSVTICSLCADALLDVVENILCCPDIIQADVITPSASSWRCSCGSVNKSNFCPKCGTKHTTAPFSPANGSWLCSCGRINKGAFCPRCGAKRP